jgi:hypothetical protein
MSLIRKSNVSIKLMMWNFTSKDLASEILSAAQKKVVRIIADDFNYSMPDSVFPFILSEKIRHHLENLEIITDSNRNKEIKDNFNVLAWYDDRLGVCRMIYKLGIFCYNVNQGLIEF